MEDTLKYQTVVDIRLQTGWSLGVILLLVILFLFGHFLTSNSSGDSHLVIYAYSAEEEAFTQGIFPAFEHAWEARTKDELNIEGVFGPSGALAGQINLGAPAKIAIFSNLNQVNWLQIGDLISSHSQPVVIGTSPIVIVTRPGNPYHLETIADLSTPGLELLHADPHSSGIAEWALLAEYGDAYLSTGCSQKGEEQLQAIWNNVRVLAPSARGLVTLFELGVGDAFLTYEQDALLAQARGVPLEIIIPPQTIIAQPVAVVIDEHVKRSEEAVAQAFVDFLVSEQGQEILGQYYLRSSRLTQSEFNPIEHPFTAEDLGGWAQVYTSQVKPFWESTVEASLALEPIPAYFNPGR